MTSFWNDAQKVTKTLSGVFYSFCIQLYPDRQQWVPCDAPLLYRNDITDRRADSHNLPGMYTPLIKRNMSVHVYALYVTFYYWLPKGRARLGMVRLFTKKIFIHVLFFQEGRISRSLIDKGIMYKQPCRDTGNKKEQFTYRVRNAKKKTSMDS